MRILRPRLLRLLNGALPAPSPGSRSPVGTGLPWGQDQSPLPAPGADGRGGRGRDSRPPASGPAPPAGSAPPRQPGRRAAAPVGGRRGRWRCGGLLTPRPVPKGGAGASPHGSASPCPHRAPPAGGRRPPRPSGPRRAGGSSRPRPGALGHSQPGGAAWGSEGLGVKDQDKVLEASRTRGYKGQCPEPLPQVTPLPAAMTSPLAGRWPLVPAAGGGGTMSWTPAALSAGSSQGHPPPGTAGLSRLWPPH